MRIRACLFRCGDDSTETGRIEDSQIRHDLAIDGNLIFDQTRDQLRVSRSVQPSRGVDAHDPETAEIAAAFPPVGRRKIKSAFDGLISTAITIFTAAAETLGQLEYCIAAPARLKTFFNSHWYFSLREPRVSGRCLLISEILGTRPARWLPI